PERAQTLAAPSPVDAQVAVQTDAGRVRELWQKRMLPGKAPGHWAHVALDDQTSSHLRLSLGMGFAADAASVFPSPSCLSISSLGLGEAEGAGQAARSRPWHPSERRWMWPTQSRMCLEHQGWPPGPADKRNRAQDPPLESSMREVLRAKRDQPLA